MPGRNAFATQSKMYNIAMDGMMSIEEGNDGRRDFRMKAAPASRPHAHDKASKFVTCVEDGKQPQCLVIHSCSYERNQTFKLI